MGKAIETLFKWSSITCSLSPKAIQLNHIEQMNKVQTGTIFDVKFFTEEFLKQFEFGFNPRAVFDTTTKLGDGLYLTYFYLENKKSGDKDYHVEPLKIDNKKVVPSDNQKFHLKEGQMIFSEFIQEFKSIFELMGDEVKHIVFLNLKKNSNVKKLILICNKLVICQIILKNFSAFCYQYVV